MRFQEMITLDEVHDLWIKINNPRYLDLSIQIETGMSLRDYFAAKATEEDIFEVMQLQDFSDGRTLLQIRTDCKFIYADTMLEAREK
jgi:hypothetical protein